MIACAIFSLVKVSKENALKINVMNNQNIYSRTRNWKELGIHARGRTHTIQYIYRSTKELTEFATRFSAGNGKAGGAAQTLQSELFPGYFDFHGPPSVIKQYATLDDLLTALLIELNGWLRNSTIHFQRLLFYIPKVRCQAMRKPVFLMEYAQFWIIMVFFTTGYQKITGRKKAMTLPLTV